MSDVIEVHTPDTAQVIEVVTRGPQGIPGESVENFDNNIELLYEIAKL